MMATTGLPSSMGTPNNVQCSSEEDQAAVHPHVTLLYTTHTTYTYTHQLQLAQAEDLRESEEERTWLMFD